MSERRHSHYSSVHWNGVPQQYASSQSYAAPGYHSPSSHHASSQQPNPRYDAVDVSSASATYSTNYFSQYAHPSTVTAVYPGISQNPVDIPPVVAARQPQSIPRSQTTVPHTNPYSHSHSHSYSQSFSHTSPSLAPARSRSNSQANSYAATPMNHPSNRYSGQVHMSPHVQSISSSQYPATPSRPFSCDLCALSFNRQHDLKRHRETHTGEKPFLCNGGCGKTFTRKDALKRHQLVKGCGKVDDAWP